MKYTLTSLIMLSILTGCGPREPVPTVVEVPKPVVVEKVPTIHLPTPPKKEIKLKEVKDTNYSDTYMYPEDGAAAKKDPVVVDTPVATTSAAMSKNECISMIGQEKFDKYSTMFGSEDASIKRCAMLKAMNH